MSQNVENFQKGEGQGLAQKINKYKVLAYMQKMKVENFLFEI